MPHLTLEYSNNINLPEDSKSLLLKLHKVLNEVGGIALGNCKSRIYRAQSFVVGDGSVDEEFVHLDIAFVSGRSEAVKANISQECLDILKASLLPICTIPVQITVNVSDIPATIYRKHPAGTLNY